MPFGGTLDPENRWVLFSSLMPWEELEAPYAPQFSPTTDAPAKSVRLAFGALFIKQRLGLTDEETVERGRIFGKAGGQTWLEGNPIGTGRAAKRRSPSARAKRVSQRHDV